MWSTADECVLAFLVEGTDAEKPSAHKRERECVCVCERERDILTDRHTFAPAREKQ